MSMRTGWTGCLQRCAACACVTVGIALFFGTAAFAQKAQKIGVVNFQQVALESKAGKAAKARLEELADRLRKQVKVEEDKLLGRQKELQAAAPKLSPAERQQRTEALERDERALNRLVQDKQEEFGKAESDRVMELARQIEPIVRAYAAEKGYTLILEGRRPGLLYYDKSLDISTEIVKRFDQASK